MTKILRIATRQSPLALWQANHVRGQLLQAHPDLQCELVPLVTTGDRFQKDRLQAIGGKGLFVKELEEAILDGRADIAVHSTKDMPAQMPEGLCLPVICKRDNPFDALVSGQGLDLDALPKHALVGTSSLRRQSQLLAYRPDLNIQPLRGNIHTRLQKLADGDFQAIILASAGLLRMEMDAHITQQIPDSIMLPACAQGALSIEVREDDSHSLDLIRFLHHPTSALCVETEREVNARLGGNCHVPLAVFCMPLDDDRLWLRAKLLSLDGKEVIEDSQRGQATKASILAEACVQALLAKGAASLLRSC
jgi:hydroxymethylbilane synthase